MAPYFYAPEDGAKYILVGPDGTRCVFNDDLDTDACGMNSSATGLDSPDVQSATDTLVEADGGYNGAFYYGNRPITLNGTVYKFADVPSRNIQLSKIMGATNAMLADGSLTFSPSWRIANNILNPSFEYGLAPWTGYAVNTVTMTQDSTWHTSGTKSGRFQYTSTSPGPYVYGEHPSVTVMGGIPYNFRCDLNITTITAGAQVFALFNWYDKNNVFISQSTIAGVSATGVQTITGTATAPSNATSVNVFIGMQSVGTFGAIDFKFDSVLLSRQSTTYLDGDMTGNWWGGTPGNSVSGNHVTLYTPFRRQQPTRFTGPWAKTYQILLTSQYAPLFSSSQPVIGPGASLSCENYGNYPAAPIVRVFGPGSNSTFNVTNTTTGAVAQVNGAAAIGAGHYVDIDMLNRIAYDDTGTSWNRYINFALTTWPTVTPRSVSTWTVDAGCTLQVTYRHCWI
jgi:hypothetical protein